MTAAIPAPSIFIPSYGKSELLPWALALAKVAQASACVFHSLNHPRTNANHDRPLS
jgi:hypothetical protein